MGARMAPPGVLPNMRIRCRATRRAMPVSVMAMEMMKPVISIHRAGEAKPERAKPALWTSEPPLRAPSALPTQK